MQEVVVAELDTLNYKVFPHNTLFIEALTKGVFPIKETTGESRCCCAVDNEMLIQPIYSKEQYCEIPAIIAFEQDRDPQTWGEYNQNNLKMCRETGIVH
jgi:hypothetical protein